MSEISISARQGRVNSLLAHMPHMLDTLPFNILAQFPPGLCLDVGAAAGFATMLLKRANPGCHVLLFEPFEGNFPHLQDVMKEFTGWEHIPKAVSNFSGEGAFYVSSTVQGAEGQWQKRQGYSSVGYMLPVDKIKDFDPSKTHTVQVCKLDDVVNEHVLLAKLDVQTTEFDVLSGFTKTLENHGASMIYAEFTGDIRVLDFLHDHGYIIFDTEYILIPKIADTLTDNIPMIKPKTIAMSTGQNAFEGPIIQRPDDFDNYCDFMNKNKHEHGFFHTDLFCVHHTFLPKFLDAAADTYKAKA